MHQEQFTYSANAEVQQYVGPYRLEKTLGKGQTGKRARQGRIESEVRSANQLVGNALNTKKRYNYGWFTDNMIRGDVAHSSSLNGFVHGR